jgi:hypothetical protein
MCMDKLNVWENYTELAKKAKPLSSPHSRTFPCPLLFCSRWASAPAPAVPSLNLGMVLFHVPSLHSLLYRPLRRIRESSNNSQRTSTSPRHVLRRSPPASFAHHFRVDPAENGAIATRQSSCAPLPDPTTNAGPATPPSVRLIHCARLGMSWFWKGKSMQLVWILVSQEFCSLNSWSVSL